MFLFNTQLWRRPEVTRLCFDSLRKLGMDVEIFAVLSETEMIPLCEEYGVKWVYAHNKPLGRKHNIGLDKALELEWDYCINVGSDDIVSPQFIPFIQPLIDRRVDFFGLNDIYFYGDHKLYYYRYPGRYTPFGAGRVTSRRMIEKIKGDDRLLFWEDDKNKGLDGSSAKIAAKYGFQPEFLEIKEPLIVDIKSNQNIWGIKAYEEKLTNKPNELLLKYYDESIIDQLKTLNTMAVKKYQYTKGKGCLKKYYPGNDRTKEPVWIQFTSTPETGIQGFYQTSDPQEIEMIENASDFGSTVIEIGGTIPKVNVEKLKAEAGWDKEFAEETHVNALASKIREKYQVEDYATIRGSAKLKKFCEDHKILAPNVFPDLKP